jgi:hypothetical protein
MSIIKSKEQDPKKSLLVTISYNPKKNPIWLFLLAAFQEFYGCHLEDKIKTPTNHTLTVFFEKSANGEQFFNMISNTNIKITKEEN